MKNLFDTDTYQMGDHEISEILANGKDFSIERFVSNGQASPDGFWYDQNEDEWVSLLQGNAELEFSDGTKLKMIPGDSLLIKAHKKHRVATVSSKPNCIWLCVFFPAG